jgi:hypothetical protein
MMACLLASSKHVNFMIAMDIVIAHIFMELAFTMAFEVAFMRIAKESLGFKSSIAFHSCLQLLSIVASTPKDCYLTSF